MKKNEEKIERLNLVLRAIRNVNKLLVKEKDRARLLQGACDNLIEDRGYYNAWIALLNESGGLITTAEAGLSQQFSPMLDRLKRGKLPHCGRGALMQSEVVLVEDPISACKNCPLSENFAGRGGMTVRLEHGGKIYGILCVSIPSEAVPDEEEHRLLEEVAGDIAFGLDTIELGEKQKQAEEALRESEKRLSQIVQASSIPTFVIDNKHIITHWNRANENLTGISSTEVIGTQKHWSAFYSQERPVMADLIVNDATEKEIAKFYGEKYRKSDAIEGGYEAEDFFPALGERGKWLFFTAAPLTDSEGKVIGAIETLQDVSEPKDIQQALQESTQELGERVKELSCLFDVSNLVETQDISLEGILQGTAELIPPAWQYPEIACTRVILEDQEFRTDNFRETPWKQGSDIVVQGKPCGALEVYYLEERPENDEGPFLKEERAMINAIAERLGRVTERVRAEEALQESETRFRDLVENSLIGISIIQEDQVVYQNPEQDRLLGPLPRPCKLTDFESIHPDDIENVHGFNENISSGKVKIYEMEFRFYPLNEAGNRLDMKWVHCRASPIEYQRRKAILVNMMDITRAKELENILRIQDKMSSLGRVSAGIAHEIRNPLSGINIYLNTLEKIYARADSLEKVKGIIGQLQSASNKIESVIRRVMDFSKPSEPKLVLTDINKPIEEAINLSSVTLRKMGIKLERDLAEDMQPCRADPNMIEQVMLNLITNAAEAMKNTEGDKRIINFRLGICI